MKYSNGKSSPNRFVDPLGYYAKGKPPKRELYYALVVGILMYLDAYS